ncbi:unnamed protein product [Linum trigynum]|uniref:RNase H type-1 domain-containing protein n=1 Tax=Linum trigynum TaxID=586398 RepID=A0AAV2FEH5_9ROSI
MFDATGNVARVSGQQYPGIQDPFLAELLAIRDVCHWCSQMSLAEVLIQGDAKLLLRRFMGLRCGIAEVVLYFKRWRSLQEHTLVLSFGL